MRPPKLLKNESNKSFQKRVKLWKEITGIEPKWTRFDNSPEYKAYRGEARVWGLTVPKDYSGDRSWFPKTEDFQDALKEYEISKRQDALKLDPSLRDDEEKERFLELPTGFKQYEGKDMKEFELNEEESQAIQERKLKRKQELGHVSDNQTVINNQTQIDKKEKAPLPFEQELAIRLQGVGQRAFGDRDRATQKLLTERNLPSDLDSDTLKDIRIGHAWVTKSGAIRTNPSRGPSLLIKKKKKKEDE